MFAPASEGPPMSKIDVEVSTVRTVNNGTETAEKANGYWEKMMAETRKVVKSKGLSQNPADIRRNMLHILGAINDSFSLSSFRFLDSEMIGNRLPNATDAEIGRALQAF